MNLGAFLFKESLVIIVKIGILTLVSLIELFLSNMSHPPTFGLAFLNNV